MVFPLYDDNTGRATTPWVNYALIALNIFVFVVFQGIGTNEHFTYSFSTVPLEIITGRDIVTPDRVLVHPVTGQRLLVPGLGETPLTVYFTLFSSMFMHGGLAHIAGNMLFLWIFGDNIEHRLGHLRFVLFYFLCGLAASFAHILFNSGSIVPAVGASGAISGVLGGYLLMFPRNRVYVLTWGGVMAVPALFMLGLWIVTQFVNGVGSIAMTDETSGGGVAYMAHIGGFVAGLVLAPLFAIGQRPSLSSPSRRDLSRWQ